MNFVVCYTFYILVIMGSFIDTQPSSQLDTCNPPLSSVEDCGDSNIATVIKREIDIGK